MPMRMRQRFDNKGRNDPTKRKPKKKMMRGGAAKKKMMRGGSMMKKPMRMKRGGSAKK